MKKSDLRTGMRITKKNGAKYIVAINSQHNFSRERDLIVNSNIPSWDRLNAFNDDLTSVYTDDTIVKVEIPKHPFDMFNINCSEYITIWERPEPIPMTLAEIEKALGYPVKIVE